MMNGKINSILRRQSLLRYACIHDQGVEVIHTAYEEHDMMVIIM